MICKYVYRRTYVRVYMDSQGEWQPMRIPGEPADYKRGGARFPFAHSLSFSSGVEASAASRLVTWDELRSAPVAELTPTHMRQIEGRVSNALYPSEMKFFDLANSIYSGNWDFNVAQSGSPPQAEDAPQAEGAPQADSAAAAPAQRAIVVLVGDVVILTDSSVPVEPFPGFTSSGNASDGVSDGASDAALDAASDAALDAASGTITGGASGAASGGASGAVSGGASGAASGTVSGAVSGTASGAASGGASGGTSGSASNAALGTAAGAASGAAGRLRVPFDAYKIIADGDNSDSRRAAQLAFKIMQADYGLYVRTHPDLKLAVDQAMSAIVAADYPAAGTSSATANVVAMWGRPASDNRYEVVALVQHEGALRAPLRICAVAMGKVRLNKDKSADIGPLCDFQVDTDLLKDLADYGRQLIRECMVLPRVACVIPIN